MILVCPQCVRLKSDEEVDFIIDGMYAIEFNGEYWHSDAVIIPKHDMPHYQSYHTMKHDAIINAGMVPLFTYEDN